MAGKVARPQAKRSSQPNQARAARRPHEVRIVGGVWKRTKLPVADAPSLRPTPDRVRETLFNWLGQDLSGWRCVDAFAGSGALGFEAASRGAAVVLMIERDRRLAQQLSAIRERLQAQAITVRCADTLKVLAGEPPASADLVFLDPPFAAGLYDQAMAAASRLLAPAGYLYVEADHAVTPPAGFMAFRAAHAGTVHYHLFIREPSGPVPPAAQTDTLPQMS